MLEKGIYSMQAHLVFQVINQNIENIQMDRKHWDKCGRVPDPTQQTAGRCRTNGNQYDHGYPADSGGKTGCSRGYQFQVWPLRKIINISAIYRLDTLGQ